VISIHLRLAGWRVLDSLPDRIDLRCPRSCIVEGTIPVILVRYLHVVYHDIRTSPRHVYLKPVHVEVSFHGKADDEFPRTTIVMWHVIRDAGIVPISAALYLQTCAGCYRLEPRIDPGSVEL
jgi:hypothetical protein